MARNVFSVGLAFGIAALALNFAFAAHDAQGKTQRITTPVEIAFNAR